MGREATGIRNRADGIEPGPKLALDGYFRMVARIGRVLAMEQHTSVNNPTTLVAFLIGI